MQYSSQRFLHAYLCITELPSGNLKSVESTTMENSLLGCALNLPSKSVLGGTSRLLCPSGMRGGHFLCSRRTRHRASRYR
jgi:hypothetical protein